MKVMIKIKNEPFKRIYENVTDIKELKKAIFITQDFEGLKDKEECFIIDLVEEMEIGE